MKYLVLYVLGKLMKLVKSSQNHPKLLLREMTAKSLFEKNLCVLFLVFLTPDSWGFELNRR